MKTKALLVVTSFIFLGLSLTNTVKAQVQWDYHGHGPFGYKDEVDGITIDQKGNTYIAGGFSNRVSFNGQWKRSRGKRDIFFSKIDPQGNTIWFKTLATKNDENIYDLTIDPNGDLILNGQQERLHNGKLLPSAITIKASSKTGEVKWKRYFTSPVGAGGNEVTTDSQGNIYTSIISWGGLNIGKEFIKPGQRKDTHLIKLSPRGKKLWSFSTTGLGVERIRAVATGYNDKRVLIGFEYQGHIKHKNIEFFGPGRSQKQGAYALLNENGKLLQFKAVTGSSHSNVRATGGFSNGLYLHGTFKGRAEVNGKKLKSAGGRDSFLMKIGKEGNPKWVRVIGNNKNEDGGEMAIHSSGDVFLTGDHSGENYRVMDKDARTLSYVFRRNYSNPTAHYLHFNKYGDHISSFSVLPTTGMSAAGVIEVNKNMELAIGIRFKGDVKVNNYVQASTDIKDKDFLVIKVD